MKAQSRRERQRQLRDAALQQVERELELRHTREIASSSVPSGLPVAHAVPITDEYTREASASEFALSDTLIYHELKCSSILT